MLQVELTWLEEVDHRVLFFLKVGTIDSATMIHVCRSNGQAPREQAWRRKTSPSTNPTAVYGSSIDNQPEKRFIGSGQSLIARGLTLSVAHLGAARPPSRLQPHPCTAPSHTHQSVVFLAPPLLPQPSILHPKTRQHANTHREPFKGDRARQKAEEKETGSGRSDRNQAL